MAWVERILPTPCAKRPGTRARRMTMRRIRRAGATCAAEGQRGGEAASLDVVKHLAISCAEWLQITETKEHRRRLKCFNQIRLMRSLRWLWTEGVNPAREKDHARVAQCQREWLGFKCCDSGRVMAVPIGCNHKLCPLCAAHRAEKYRARVSCLFDRLNNPWFLTLTVPNVRRLSKRTYSTLRRRVRVLLKQYEPWVAGGVYSLETTWNRKDQTWHVHVHVLLDAQFSPPARRSEFIRFKRQLEFDWMRITGGTHWSPGDFATWFSNTNFRANHEAQAAAMTAWNRINRRVVDIRPVRDRRGAAFEVFKYITKVCDFVDDPFAVEGFLRGSRGVRMLQTFGTWYGFKFDAPEGAAAGLKCTAGCTDSHWRKIGRFYRECIESLPDGTYAVRREMFEKKERTWPLPRGS